MLRRLAAAAFCILLTGRGLAAEAGWEQELRQMGYLFLHLSNINVINGLNLTREQAVRLQGLARQIEQVAPQPPAFDAPVSPQIAEIRKAWLEMREVLLRGEDPSKALRDRAGKAFVAKSAFVRSTVRAVPAAANTQCSSCHQKPTASKGLGFGPMTVGPALQRRVGLAHSQSLYGNHGLWKLALLARQADDLLTDGQKGILGSFSCCIAPPDDLSNPTRAGQADTNAKEMAILRNDAGRPGRHQRQGDGDPAQGPRVHQRRVALGPRRHPPLRGPRGRGRQPRRDPHREGQPPQARRADP